MTTSKLHYAAVMAAEAWLRIAETEDVQALSKAIHDAIENHLKNDYKPYPEPCEYHCNVTWLARVPSASWCGGQECFGCFIEAKHKELLNSEGWEELREAAIHLLENMAESWRVNQLDTPAGLLGQALRRVRGVK